MERFVDKVLAQKRAQRSDDFVVIARYGGRSSTGRMRAMKDTFRELQWTGSFRLLEDRIGSLGELLELQGMPAPIESRR